jgi:hypothetical protein
MFYNQYNSDSMSASKEVLEFIQNHSFTSKKLIEIPFVEEFLCSK